MEDTVQTYMYTFTYIQFSFKAKFVAHKNISLDRNSLDFTEREETMGSLLHLTTLGTLVNFNWLIH